MSKDIRIKKGLDIKLVGVAEKTTTQSSLSSVYAIKPEDFHGITPKLIAREGAKVKAGEALFFNNKTIHASPPNTTNKARVGIGLGITQKAAEIRHYYLKPGTKDKLLKYKTDTGFYTKYDNPGLAKMYEAGRLIEGYEMVSEVPYKMMSF